MLAIKLKRVGKKGQISYRVVVGEKRSKLQGKFTEDLGWWNAHTNTFTIAKDRALYWIEKGAQPTASVHNLLVKSGAIQGPKKAVHASKKEKKKA